jgi:hypothetical protein
MHKSTFRESSGPKGTLGAATWSSSRSPCEGVEPDRGDKLRTASLNNLENFRPILARICRAAFTDPEEVDAAWLLGSSDIRR